MDTPGRLGRLGGSVADAIVSSAEAAGQLGASAFSASEEFCKRLPDQASVRTAKQLIATAEEHGAVINRKDSGLTISVQSTLRGPPLTVAWLFPTMNPCPGTVSRDSLFGQVNWVELPEEAQVGFDELYRQMSRDGFAEEVGNDKAGGARGWAVDPAVVAQHIGPMKERLTRAIAILQSL